jgi:hypothetical protein
MKNHSILEWFFYIAHLMYCYVGFYEPMIIS